MWDNEERIFKEAIYVDPEVAHRSFKMRFIEQFIGIMIIIIFLPMFLDLLWRKEPNGKG